MSPQADYVVSNGTGAAVRSDINGQLAAIVSNNSGASAPATTYAYQFWADTSTSLLKVRNGANSAWITVGDLTAANLGLATLASPIFTGTATIPTLTVSTAANIPLGSAASPTLYFTGDSNTGLYSPGADQLALSTGGTGRLFIDSSGRVGVGTSSPSNTLHVAGTGSTQAAFERTGSNGVFIGLKDGSGNLAYIGNTNGVFSVQTPGSSYSDKLVVTSAGLVGVGTTSPSSLLHLEGSDGVAQIRLQRAGTNIYGIIRQTSAPYGLTYDAVDVNTGAPAHAFRTSVDGSTFTERARIDSSGRLLVGTSSTSTTTRVLIQGNSSDSTGTGVLFVASGKNNPTSSEDLALLRFGDSGHARSAEIGAYRDGGTWTSGSSQPTRLSFSTTADGASSPTERMRIDSAGNVLIRKTSAVFTGAGTWFETPTDPSTMPMYLHFCKSYSGQRDAVNFFHNGTRVGYIAFDNSSATYSTSSDYRLKENVVTVTDGIARLQDLKPSRFNFISDPDKTVDGFIAHEVQEIVPEAITGVKDAVDEDGNPIYQGIDQSKLVPLLTAALQEAVAKIESLEARLTAAGL